MRTTIVPAQITTVEDKIAGNLNLTQILLLLTPVFIGSGIYILFPPYAKFEWYKPGLILFIVFVCGVSAIRFKERILIQWIAVLLRYTGRPRYYICDKNDPYFRDMEVIEIEKHILPEQTFAQQKAEKEEAKEIHFLQRIRLDAILTHPKANVSFKTAKKGGMYVSLTEIK